MNNDQQWVALLTEDEDDYAYWQYGFGSWATHLRIEWFSTGDAFFARPGLMNIPPAVLLLDGLIPMDEEPHWLAKILKHECCRGIHVIMLADQFPDDQQQLYMDMGAAACMIKPINQQDLQKSILAISQFAIV